VPFTVAELGINPRAIAVRTGSELELKNTGAVEAQMKSDPYLRENHFLDQLLGPGDRWIIELPKQENRPFRLEVEPGRSGPCYVLVRNNPYFSVSDRWVNA